MDTEPSDNTIKAASRHLLLAEFILGVFLVAWGAGKGVDPTQIAALGRKSAVASGWILPCLIGAVQVCLATTEWLRGKDWTQRRLQKHVGKRALFSGLAATMWVYDLKEFVLDPVVLSAVVLILVAPVCVGVNLYSLYENRRVWVALDPDVPTSRLRFDR